MTWEQLEAKHTKERKEYWAGYEQSLSAMYKAKNEILRAYNYREADMPESVLQQMDDLQDNWAGEWGPVGDKTYELNVRHDKEIEQYYKTLSQMFQRMPEKDSGKDRGR